MEKLNKEFVAQEIFNDALLVLTRLEGWSELEKKLYSQNYINSAKETMPSEPLDIQLSIATHALLKRVLEKFPYEIVQVKQEPKGIVI